MPKGVNEFDYSIKILIGSSTILSSGPCLPAIFADITYSVLSLEPGGNQASDWSQNERGEDKTCWTKPRSRSAVAAMGI
jgi:hypothetical protein